MAPIGRREVLGRAGLVAAGVALGGGGETGRELWAAQRKKADFDASVGCPARRGAAKVFWSGPDEQAKLVALTFDDGPTEQLTAKVLDVLAAHDVPATFFMIGECVRRHPDLARRVRDAGHQVANHTFDHQRAPGAHPGDVEKAVAEGASTVRDVLGVTPTHFRPTRGELTTVLLHAVAAGDQDVVLWSLDRGPGADGDVDAVARHLAEGIHPGAVVCLHDGIGRSSFDGDPDGSLLLRRTTELAALPRAIEAWKAAGYRFVTVAQLFTTDTIRD